MGSIGLDWSSMFRNPFYNYFIRLNIHKNNWEWNLNRHQDRCGDRIGALRVFRSHAEFLKSKNLSQINITLKLDYPQLKDFENIVFLMSGSAENCIFTTLHNSLPFKSNNKTKLDRLTISPFVEFRMASKYHSQNALITQHVDIYV